jgi:hypothetical protein
MLMYSWSAIWALVRPWATRGDELPFPGAERIRAGRTRLRQVRVGEDEGVLGRGGQAHRRTALHGCAGSGGPECLPDFAQQLLSAARRADTLGGGQVPGLCQHLGQDDATQAG